MFIFSKTNFFSVLLLTLLFFSFFVFAQESNFDPVKSCPNFVEDIDKECEKMGQKKCQEILEICENYYQKKSEQYQTELSKIKEKEKTLQNEIWTLTKKIENLNYKITKNNLIIKDLNIQIKDTEKSIDKTNSEISRVKGKIKILLQLRYEQDQKSFLEVFLSETNLSNFFDELVALESLNRETQELLENIKGLKNSLETQQNIMVSEKESLEKTQILTKVNKEEEEELKTYKNNLLKKTKGEESLYQKYLKETEAKAQEIRKKIFELAQIAEAQALTLEQVYNLAKEIEKITGIRPAFLLGLLQVESAIGKNVGQCNCGKAAFCRHPEISWKQVMTQKHWSYFEQITRELGLDINSTPVSCAVNGGKVQWGGAMGPAQFMPSTWLELGFKQRVENITGNKPSNPWRIKDAFLAAGLYLADFGANSQEQGDEIDAARAYLCGTTKLTRRCRTAGGESYAYQIMKNASKFQKYIDDGILN